MLPSSTFNRSRIGILVVLAVLPAAVALVHAQIGSPQAPHRTAPLAAPPYAFDRPDTLFRLSNRLREISGLTVLDDQTLGAIQDEKGKLYLINLHTGKIEDDSRFGKDGDYEALARVSEQVFVLRNDGTLYEIKNWRAKKLKTTKHKTKLSAKYDTEGLAYDAAHARLLIACKEYAGKGLKNRKAVYAFDLERDALLDEPVYLINRAKVNEQASAFKPSALALHPITGEIYVLSSVRKAMAVLNPEGELVAVWPLPGKRFRQPEGMAFLTNGDLFIASEGNGKKAVLMRFNYRP